MSGALESLALNLLGAALIFAFGSFWARLVRKTKARRLWPLSSDTMVVLSKSTETDTGVYKRPSTGIGQVRALAMITPTLSELPGVLEVNRVVLSDYELNHQIEKDLILIGGVKNNEVTRMMMKRLGTDPRILSQSDSVITWDGLSYEGEANSDGKIETDHGYIIRCRNPFGKKNSKIIILAGSHTYGSLAAARWYVEESQKRDSLVRNVPFFQGLVTVDLIKGHITPPKLIRIQVLND